jgi:uncharacterized protein (TIGR02001 family)
VVGAGRGIRYSAIVLIGVLLTGNARCQVSGEAAIASDNEYRGVSLNGNHPAPSFDISFDSASGWFVGGLASEVQFYQQTHSSAEIVADAGYAYPLAPGLAWEVGATYSIFPNFTFYNYNEVFVGLSSTDWSARLYYSPDYFGRRVRTIYAEFNYAHPLGDHIRLLSHVGMLQGASGAANENMHTFDARLGVGSKPSDNVRVQLDWVATNGTSYVYPVGIAHDHHEWVLSVAYIY